MFESDRSGAQQLYVMNADGSSQRRISFGGGATPRRCGAPTASGSPSPAAPATACGIGVMSPTGSDERMLTPGLTDEGPSWAAGSRELLFQRTEGGPQRLYRVAVDGGEPRRIVTPQDGSDPDWSGARE